MAAERLNRKGYGFEIKKDFFTKASAWLAEEKQIKEDIKLYGFARSLANKTAPTLF